MNIRRTITQVLHCDFLSMYPTVCTLMGLWRYVIADRMTMRDATEETRTWLDQCGLADLQHKDAWRQLTVLVQVEPDDDIFPVRARYGGAPSLNIGVNRLTSKQPLWFSLADCAASKLLCGKAPKIVRAFGFGAGEPQAGLCPINISGKTDYRVDPVTDDFYKRIIDLRREVRTRAKSESGPLAGELNSDQLALKLLANATSYGIFAEFNVSNLDSAETLVRYGSSGRGDPIQSRVFEEPGQYFHPVVAALITGGARLMLALTERLAIDRGLSWVFCDTDSMAIAKPDEMDQATFLSRALEVVDWFRALNPYVGQGSILQVEDVNYEPGKGGDATALRPLYCFAVSAKRYAEFNIGPDGEPLIRKASAHGLGHLLPPYPDPAKPSRMKAKSVELWQEDLWLAIIRAAMDDDPVKLRLDYHAGLMSPAASRYAATTPALLAWFKTYNADRASGQQVQPFNFLLAYHSLKLEMLAADDPQAHALWQRQKRDPRPAAPYNTDPIDGARQAFDRESGEPIPAAWLESYGRNLAQYHLHPEVKFWGGGWTERGPLRRRHVEARAVQHIGKEADRWEEQQYVGAEEDDRAAEYGFTAEDRARMFDAIRSAKARFGVRALTRAARVSDNTLAAMLKPGAVIRDGVTVRLIDTIDRLEQDATDEGRRLARLMAWAEMRIALDGLPALAVRLLVDPANLRKSLNGNRSLSRAVIHRMEQQSAQDTE